MPQLPKRNQELFAQAIAKGQTQQEAYVGAGYAWHPPSASRLLTNAKVRARISELRERAAVKVDETIADIAAQLDEARDLARSTNQPAAMTAAIMGKAKVLGLIVDKAQLSGKDGGPIQTNGVVTYELPGNGRD